MIRTFVFTVITFLAACGDDGPMVMVHDSEVCLTDRSEKKYCIDTFEAARDDSTMTAPGSDAISPRRSIDGRLPWAQIGWEAAKTACESINRRLCEEDEWVDACDGAVGDMEGTKYTYGDAADTTKCNLSGGGPKPTGTIASCKSAVSVFDMSGNLAEWTGNTSATAAVRGGSYASSGAHACKDVRPIFGNLSGNDEIGFRCCRTRNN